MCLDCLNLLLVPLWLKIIIAVAVVKGDIFVLYNRFTLYAPVSICGGSRGYIEESRLLGILLVGFLSVPLEEL